MSNGRTASAAAPATRSFFAKLRGLPFGSGKPDLHENLLDVLELAAVHVGGKPAHLQGHGQHDASTLAAIEVLALEAGLHTRRTSDLPEWTHRAYTGDAGYYAASRKLSPASHERLWVFRDEAVARQIDAVLDGALGVGAVLGYPSCCEIANAEESLMLWEAMEVAYREEYGARTTDDLIQFAREDRPVNLSVDPGAGMWRTVEAYPFVQFTACGACLRDRGSPAAKANNSLRILARDLDRAFAREITAAAGALLGSARAARGSHELE